MTAAELIERIKDNPDGEVLIQVDDERRQIVRIDEPYQGATVLHVGQVTTHEG